MKRSVVVATWQRASLLRGCLDAVDAQTTAVDEVIVVGRSDDIDARRLVDAFEGRMRPRWVEVSEPGHLPPVIKGLAEATGDIVAFLDDDAEPEATWLEALTEPFKDRNVACVGGRSTGPGGIPDEVEANEAGRFSWYGRFWGRFGALPSPDPVPVDGILEGNSAWRKEILGGLRFTRLFLDYDSLHYGMDLSQQAKAIGYQILYAPAARAYHHLAPRAGIVAREDRMARCYQHARNYTYIALTYFRGIRRVVFPFWWLLVGERQAYGLLTAIWDVAARGRSTWKLARASFRGRWDGFMAWRART
jgi:GT2 family glycosyltransferase